MTQKIHNIVLSNQEKLFECPSNDSILDAGLRHGSECAMIVAMALVEVV